MSRAKDFYKIIFLLAGDAGLIILSFTLAIFIRFGYLSNVVDYYTGATVFILFAYLISFYVFQLYNIEIRFRSTAFLAEYITGVAIGTAVIMVIFYIFPHWKMGRGILLINAFFVFYLCLGWRIILQSGFKRLYKKNKIVIVGAGYAGRTIFHIIKSSDRFSVQGFIDDDPQKIESKIEGIMVLGSSEMLHTFCRETSIDSIVVAITNEKRRDLLNALLECKMAGIEIYDMQTLYEELTGKLPVNYLREGWLVYSSLHGIQRNIYTIRVKRVIDFAVSVLALLVLLPLILVTAVVIRLSSKGPVFFIQERVGKNGKVFKIIKFRSMVADAEPEGTAVYAKENDPRVTAFGKILRKLRIDEIPQIWNVLRGDMSFIGPRPERPEFVEGLEREIKFYSLRHSVPPGITGWAQINYRYGASKEDALEKLQYDLYYVKNCSFLLDIHILLMTIRVVLFGKGAR
ncbi:MAG: sugar transferase [Candidatus Omnitrophota bacterium]|jgi:sugar transferase (PEP-CTERM system associated)